jgi:hypothetical protein
MLKNDIVTLEPAGCQNVGLLVRRTLDPVAQPNRQSASDRKQEQKG